MKKAKALLLIISSIFLLSGCYDSREIDETAYIIALGIDAAEPDGYRYTFQLANPLEMTSGEEESSGKNTDSSARSLVVTASDFYIARNQLNNHISKSIDMSHLKLIVFSKELESTEFLHHSQFLMHERQVRPHTNVAISDGKAEDFIKSVKPTLEANTAKYYELIGLRSDSLYAPSVTISTFLDKLSTSEKAVALPLAKSGTNDNIAPDTSEFWISASNAQISSEDASMQGMVVFKDGEICGFMDSDCALIFNILSGRIDNCTIALKNPSDATSNLIFKLNIPKSTGYKIESADNKYRITITKALDIEVVGSFLPKGFATTDELYNFARQAITQKITAFVYDTSRTKAADILNIGGHVDGQLEYAENWQNIFETGEFIINIV